MKPIRFEVGAYFFKPVKEREKNSAPFAGGKEISVVYEEEVPRLLADPKQHPSFVRRLLERAKRKRLRDVTFIGVTEEFTPLAETIREKTELTIRVGIRAAREQWEKLPSFDPLVDHYDLLAFDYHIPQEGQTTNFHTLLPSIHCSVDSYSKLGISKKKMNLGLCAFGKVYKRVSPGIDGNGYEQPCRGRQPAYPDISYSDIEKYLLSHPAAKVFHTSVEGVLQSFLYNSENGDWISFDDPDTLKSKAFWGQKQGLGGVFLWGADGDNSAHAELMAVESWNARKNWTKI